MKPIMLRLLTAATYFFLIYSSLVSQSYACVCNASKSRETIISETENIFIGKVVEKRGVYFDVKTKMSSYHKQDGSSKFPIQYEYEILVIDKFKGESTSLLELMSAGRGNSCYYELDKDATYLIYADQSPHDHRLYTTLCSGNKKLSEDALHLIQEILFLERKER